MQDMPLALVEPYQTPFAEFMAELLRTCTPSKTTMLGTAIWSEPPYTTIISLGLWKIFEQVAERRGELLSTESRVDGIARVVDHLVNTGILLVHQSPVRAAQAFKTQIIAAQLAKLQQTHRTSAVPMDDVWRLSAASFFAPLIKSAQEYGRNLVQRARYIQSKNLFRTNGALFDGGLPFVEQQPIHRIEERGLLLSITADVSQLNREHGYVEDTYQALIKADATLKSSYATILLFEEFRFLSKTIPADAFSTLVSIEDGLIPTQILLAALDIEGQNHLRASLYASAKKALDSCTQAEISARTFKRLTNQMPQLNAEQERLLKQFIETGIKEIRQWEPELTPTKKCSLFLVFYAEDLSLNPKIAQDTAMYGETTVTRSSTPISARQRGILQKKLARGINWKKLKMQDFLEILHRESLEPIDVVNGIASMAEELQAEAIKQFLACAQCNQESMAQLIKRRLVTPDKEFILEHVQLMPQNVLKEAFETEFLSTKNPDMLYTLTVHMEQRTASSIFTKKKWRVQLVELFTDIISNSSVSHRMRMDLKRALGAELWEKFVLAADVRLRETEYRHPPSAKATKTPIIAWVDGWDAQRAHGLFTLSHILNQNPTEVMALLQRTTEIDTFRWLHEGNPHRIRLLTQYNRSRNRYYRLLKK